ncbi:DUF2919 family protein [Alteromonas sp. CYL-A6]|uniref:DUF2919 family protein n=1 Tax=Alteromonas nitratireducens TaxID=3390813 RepID=UPI0034C15240
MLKLPLHCYDEAGHILPPRWLYWLFAFACIDWLVLVFALASMQQTHELLALFYPDRVLLGTNLVAGFPVVIALVLTAQRERLWKRGWIRWAAVIRPLLITGLLTIAGLQVWAEIKMHWQFQAYSGLRLFMALACLYAVARSRHVRWMLEDWKKGPVSDTDPA